MVEAQPVGCDPRFVGNLSMSRSLPVLSPAKSEIARTFAPRSNPDTFALTRPTIPVVKSLFVAPTTVRFAAAVPAARLAPFGRWMPRAGRNDWSPWPASVRQSPSH